MTKIKRLAGPFFWGAMTTGGYRQIHPRCRGGDKKQFRYLAWHGDAMLYLTTTKYLLEKNGFGNDDEQALGQLSERRDSLVSRVQLWKVAQLLALSEKVRRRRNEQKISWSYEAECVEAIVGAIAKHSGEAVAEDFVRENIIVPLSDSAIDDRVALLQSVVKASATQLPEPVSQRLELQAQLEQELQPHLPRATGRPRFLPTLKPSQKNTNVSGTFDLRTLHLVMKSFPKPIRRQISEIMNTTKKGSPEWKTRLPRIQALVAPQPIAA